MTIIRKALRFCFSIYGFAVFLLLMFLLLPLFIYSFLQKPIKGGNLIFKISRFWADAFFIMVGIRHWNIYEEPHDVKEEYIFVSNHISYLDIPMMMKVIRGQHIRILGKAEMSKIPIFGSIYKRGTVSVERENPAARAKSVKRLIMFIRKKISVFICPEGTFNMTHYPGKSICGGAFGMAIADRLQAALAFLGRRSAGEQQRADDHQCHQACGQQNNLDHTHLLTPSCRITRPTRARSFRVGGCSLGLGLALLAEQRLEIELSEERGIAG